MFCADLDVSYLFILKFFINFAIDMPVAKTKVKLVDIARQLFAKQGFENTTMNDIAQTSGKGRRTLYTYFKNKEEIYDAVIESELDRISCKMDLVAQKDMNLEDKLVELIYTHLNLIKEAVQRNGNLRAEFFRNILLVSKVRKNFDHNEIAILTRLLEQGVNSGIYEVESIPLLADIIHYSVRGLEVPYIYGRLSEGLPSGLRKSIVHKLLHKALCKQG